MSSHRTLADQKRDQRSPSLSESQLGNTTALTGEGLFEYLLGRLSGIFVCLGVLSFSAVIYRAHDGRWHPLLSTQLLLMAMVLGIIFFHKYFKPRFTAIGLLTMAYVIGVLGILRYGSQGTGSAIVLVGVSVMVGAIYGRRWGLMCTALVSLSFAFLTIGSLCSWWPRTFMDLESADLPYSSWVHLCIITAVVSVAVILFIAAIQERFLLSIERNEKENAFIQGVINAQQDLFLVFDPVSGELVYWNDSFRQFVGLDDAEIRARKLPGGWQDIINRSSANIEGSLKKLLEGSIQVLETELCSCHGEIIPIEFRATVVELPGHDRLAVCIGRDIRERRALRDSERYLGLITQNMPVVAWALNHGGQLIYMSPNVQDVCGFTAEEILRDGLKLWVPQVHADDQAGFREAFMKVLHGQGMSDYKYRFTTKDGREIWLHERAVETSGDQSEPAVCGTFWDITEQVRMTDHLRQSEKLQALGELVGGIAHDFNNQISAMSGLAELLQIEELENDVRKRYLNELLKCAHYAAALPKQLLTFARRDPQKLASHSIHDAIEQTVFILRRSIAKSIRINLCLSAKNPFVYIDSNQFQNALLNLCINARDAMLTGGELIVSTWNTNLSMEEATRRSLTAGEYLCLSVRDTGEGMSDETRQRAFEPFYTTKPEGKGTGMGLAMVFGFVKGMGGDVEIQSRLGQGTTFNMILPTYKPNDERRCRKNGMKSVLLVDDERDVLGMIASMLTETGMNVVACHSSKQALDEYKKHGDDFFLAILDMILPETSGTELLSEIRQQNSSIPILLISAYASDEEIREALGKGASGYLPKPFEYDELTQKIQTILS